jgi:polysaccharide export outer membrane protein
MFGIGQSKSWATSAIAVGICVLFAGCLGARNNYLSGENNMPTELNRVTLPDHVVAPTDILLIEAVRLMPKPPYKIAALDVLFIQVTVSGTKKEEKDQKERRDLLPGQPIEGMYRVDPEGKVDLGFDYGSVLLIHSTIPDAKDHVKKFLQKRFKLDFDVQLELVQSRGMQAIERGEYLVQPDGKVSLGGYGQVLVTGLTLEQAREAIQRHLSLYFQDPEISLDIGAFNSRAYYVIFDLADAGQQVNRLPATGNETVLDAIGEVKGLPAGTSRMRIWIARPSPANAECDQILPVDWEGITKGARTARNYQVLPGDRIFVSVDPLIAADSFLAKVISPIERLMGVTLLGTSTVRSFRSGGGGNGGGFGGF